jgi:hypothetical protein
MEQKVHHRVHKVVPSNLGPLYSVHVPQTISWRFFKISLQCPGFQSGLSPSEFLTKILYAPSPSYYLSRNQKCRLLTSLKSVQIRVSLFQFLICQDLTLTSFSASFSPHDDHPLSAFYDCLLIIFSAALRIWLPSSSSRRRAKPRRQISVNLISAKSLLVLSTALSILL